MSKLPQQLDLDSHDVDAQAGRILVFDDDAQFRYTLCSLLERSHFRVVEAGDAVEALAALRDESISLIISDINAPGNENLEFVREISENRPELPVIIVTGYPTVETAIDAVGLSVAAYLKKPFENEELLTNVRQALLRVRLLRNLQKTRVRMEEWRQSLNDIETLASLVGKASSKSVPIDAYIALTVQNIIDPLFDLVHLSEGLVEPKSDTQQNVCNLFKCPRVESHERMIGQTIDTLEKTKQSFKSKTLAELRSRLEKYLEV